MADGNRCAIAQQRRTPPVEYERAESYGFRDHDLTYSGLPEGRKW
jgi:hypothetical protein